MDICNSWEAENTNYCEELFWQPENANTPGNQMNNTKLLKTVPGGPASNFTPVARAKVGVVGETKLTTLTSLLGIPTPLIRQPPNKCAEVDKDSSIQF